MSDLQEGDDFAGHRVLGVAGRGGMGVVYRARQLDLDRDVALKLITPSLAQDAGFRDRFLAESRAAAAIDHPNVLPVYYAGEHGDRLYIAMRFVEGEDLRSLVRREGRLPPARAAHIVAQVGDALDAAHARGLVHRDVKPANVLVDTSDHVYLTDFGLTKRMDTLTASHAGGWVGTLGYVSPEQIRGEPTDARSDVYALGCILFGLLTGSTPFQRDSDEATLWAHLNDTPPSVSSVIGEVPAGFDEVVARALEKSPDARFQSAGDLGRAALAAAGREVPLRPERVVARGAAAPGAGEETVVTPDAGGRTVVQARPVATGSRPRRTTALVALGALAAAAVGVVLVLSKGDGGTPGTLPGPSSQLVARVTSSVPAGVRPNAIVATRDYVWVASSASTRAILIDAQTGRLAAGNPPTVGAGVTALAARGNVFVLNGSRHALLTFESDGTAIGTTALPTGGQPVAVATTPSAVWVGIRNSGGVGLLVKVDPKTSTSGRTITLQRDLQNFAVGEGSLWVIDSSRDQLTRISTASGAETARIPLEDDAYAVAVGHGSVWVTNQADGTVTRISAKTNRPIGEPILVGRRPYGIDVAGNFVWVANNQPGTATLLDAATGRRVGAQVRLGGRPFAVSARSRDAWFTLLQDNLVVRVKLAATPTG